jgi:hypothetical protein
MTIYKKRTRSKIYRKVYELNYGKIPKDSDGRTYEIHHIDGNSNNNDPSNLVALSIEDHMKTHYEQGDFGAAFVIAKRMGMPSEEISEISKKSVRKQIEDGTHNFQKTGKDHHSYDHTLHKFENVHTGEVVEMTRGEFKDKFLMISSGTLSSLILGRKRTYNGWKMYGKETSPEYRVHIFENIHTGEVVQMMRKDFVKLYNLNSGHITQLIKRNPKTKSVKGWIIKE